MKIYTKGGDKGRTSIFGGERVDKDNIRVEANGCVDEFNSILGIVRAHMPAEHEWQPLLYTIQKNLMSVMSHIATPSDKRVGNPNKLDETLVVQLEEMIDDLTAAMGENSHFLLPGGTVISSYLHLARTSVRECERRLCTLNKIDPVTPEILQYFNRLSDLLFVMARYDLHRAGITEERWHNFQYKRSNK